jgi:hypothetical protein
MIRSACLFCSYQTQDEHVSADLLASLLKQLVQERPVLPDVIKTLHKSHTGRNTRPSFDELSKVLRSVVDSYSRVFFIVDALDVCTNTNGARERFLLTIFELQNQTKISLFATSRIITEIFNKFEGSMSLEIRARDEDVLKYLDGHMSGLPSCASRNPNLQRNIKTEIVKTVDGMCVLSNPI